MRRAKFFLAIAAAAALAGCANNRLTIPEPVTTVKVVQTTSYPELPDILLPLEPELLTWAYEVPRDTSRTVLINSAKCRALSDKGREDSAVPDECQEHPVIADTNVLFGFDQRNWNILLTNFSKLREYIFQLRARVELANKSRQEWRDKAEQERRRFDAERQKAESAPAATRAANRAASAAN